MDTFEDGAIVIVHSSGLAPIPPPAICLGKRVTAALSSCLGVRCDACDYTCPEEEHLDDVCCNRRSAAADTTTTTVQTNIAAEG